MINIRTEFIHYSAGFFCPAICFFCFLVGASLIGAGFTNVMNSSITRVIKVCKTERNREEISIITFGEREKCSPQTSF